MQWRGNVGAIQANGKRLGVLWPLNGSVCTPMWPRYAQCKPSFTQWWPSVPLSPLNVPPMGFQCPDFTPMGGEWSRPPSRWAFYAYTLRFYYYFTLASGLTAYARRKKLGKKPVRIANGSQWGDPRCNGRAMAKKDCSILLNVPEALQ